MKKINKQCPKCGYDDVVMTYVEEGTTFHMSNTYYEILKPYFKKSIKVETFPSKYFDIAKECIIVHCRTCQYSWVEDTIDKIKVPKEFNFTISCGDITWHKFEDGECR